MKNLHLSTDEFDKNAINLGFSEQILQENAARSVASLVKKRVKFGSNLLFLCGKGNNASDAIASARMLSGSYECFIVLIFRDLNENAKFQLNLARNLGVQVKFLDEINLDEFLQDIKFKAIVDGIFGSNFKGELSFELQNLLQKINLLKALKIAVDFPSGLDKFGRAKICFKADFTIAMGGLKLGLFSDFAKDFVGKITLANLGLDLVKFEKDSEFKLLELSDLLLPFRSVQNTHKGHFGSVGVVAGEFLGAARIAGLSALNLGAGKVSLIGQNLPNFDYELICTNEFKASVFALGMGLGKEVENLSYKNLEEILKFPCVIDADMFYSEFVRLFLGENCVLTPHPKEFAALCEICGLGKFDTKKVQENRFELAKEFSCAFKATLVLKGANTIIAKDGKIFVSNLGSSKLSVAGSGDALAGAIVGFLALGYSPLNASISGVLAHAKTAINSKVNDYAFGARDIVEGFKWL